MERVDKLRADDFFADGLPLCVNHYVYDPHERIRMHSHEFIEIAYVCKGKGTHVVGGREQPVSMGDLFIIQFDTPHSFFPLDPDNTGRLEVYNCMFMPEIVGSLPLELPVLQEITSILLLSGLYPGEQTYQPDLKLPDSQDHNFRSIFTALHEEYSTNREGRTELLKLKLCELLIQIYRAYGNRNKSLQPNSDTYKLELIQKAVAYLREHYASPVQLNDISRHALLSKSYFSALFKKTTGMSVFDYLQRLRIEEACRLLEEGTATVTEIAARVGYNDYRFFNKTFRKVTGKTAREYRNGAASMKSLPEDGEQTSHPDPSRGPSP